MSDVAPRIVLLSGLPGAGKTHYAEHLEQHGWLRFEYDEWQRTPDLADAFHRALAGEDAPIQGAAVGHPGLVLEWGFPVSSIEDVRALLQRPPYEPAYLDGDHAQALEAWKKAHEGLDEVLWHTQANALEAVSDAIDELYGQHRIRTVEADGSRLEAEVIDGLLEINHAPAW